MSVLIKGMEMPESCDSCWALDYSGDYPRCRITDEQRGYNFRVREKRMDKCPLVEIPTPHGRLIDAGSIYQETLRYSNRTRAFVQKIVEALSTVIEAEEGEG